MMNDFEPNRFASFTKHELTCMEKSLKLNIDQCQSLLNSVNRLLKQVNYIVVIRTLDIHFFKPLNFIILICLGNK